MESDTKEFVRACTTYAHNKTPNQPCHGLLQPLLIPKCPWSHIAVDFVTGLLPSQGNTTILTIVDRFSKAVHFDPLPKLPSAKETAEALVHNVFRLHGIPTNSLGPRAPIHIGNLKSLLHGHGSHSEFDLRVSPSI